MAKRQYSSIVPVNNPRVPSPVAEEIYNLTSPHWVAFAVVNVHGGKLPAPLGQSVCHRAHILHWVVKLKYDSKHRMPKVPKGRTNTYKPLGVLYWKALELSLQLPETALRLGLRHGADLWRWLLVEHALEGVPCNYKPESIKRLKRQNAILRDYKNPFDSGRTPYTWALIEDARLNAERLDHFRKDYWSPFMNARTKWCTAYQGPEWRQVSEQDGTYFMRKAGKDNRLEELRSPTFPVVEKMYSFKPF